MTKNVLNLIKAVNSWISDTQWLPSTRNMKKTTTRQSMIKLFKICDEDNLESRNKEKIHSVGKNKGDSRFLVRNTASEKTVENLTSPERNESVKLGFYTQQMSLINESKIKNYSDTVKLKRCHHIPWKMSNSSL